jgi:hypothetical protein
VARHLPPPRALGVAPLVPPRAPPALAAAIAGPGESGGAATTDLAACGRELLA